MVACVLVGGLAALVAEGRKAWPELALDEAVFAAYVRARGDDPSKLRAADLWLACACLEGDEAAARELEAKYLARLPALLGGGGSKDAVGEVVQRLRVQLLVGRDGKPGTLAGYAGRGDLMGWLRVVATRELVRVKDEAARSVRAHTDELARLVDPDGADPELGHMRRTYGEAFRKAFADAVGGLDLEDRELLRRQVVGGEGIDELAGRLGVHRATAARRLERARDRLRQAVRELLVDRLGVGESELESALRLMDSGFDASVERVLVEASPPPKKRKR